MYVSAWKRAALCLACLGLILPQPMLSASETKTRSNDISLTKGGVLVGSVVDADGRIVGNAPVNVKFNGYTVASTRSNSAGKFAIRGLRGGVHEICTTGGSTVGRFWTNGSAPNAAKPAAVVVKGTGVVRSQGAGLLQENDLLIGSMLVGGMVTAIIIAANDNDDPTSSP